MNNNINLVLGEVRAVNDPQQMGRMKVYCKQIDPDGVSTDELAWIYYSSPSGGMIQNGDIGDSHFSGGMSYGLWSPIQVGSQVIVAVVNGDSSFRVVLGCVWLNQSNRTLPGGININGVATTNNGNVIKSLEEGSKKQNVDPVLGIDKNVAQNKTNKDGSSGYGTSNSGQLAPQSYCWTTPGGHYIYMCDRSDNSKVRLRSSKGSTISIDDTNNQIAIANGQGTASIRLNGDGSIDVFSNSDISFNANNNINMTCKNFNISSDNYNALVASSIKINSETFDLNACGNAVLSSCGNFSISSAESTLSLYGSNTVMVNNITWSYMSSSGASGNSMEVNSMNINVISDPSKSFSNGTGTSKLTEMKLSEVKAGVIGTNAVEGASADSPSKAPNY